ncbi:MAG: LTA synthase family protein [Propioniciclava sp.]
MSPPQASKRWAAHPHSRVAQLAVLTVGLGIYSVTLKVIRIRAQYEFPPDIWPGIQAAADVAFAVGWVVLWVGSYLVSAREWVRRSVFTGAYSASLLVMLVVFFNHELVMKTGSSLSLSRIVQAIVSPEEIGAAVATEFSLEATVRLGIGLAVVLILPPLLSPLITYVADQIRHWPEHGQVQVAAHWRIALPVMVVGCAVLSAWSPATASAQFARAPLTNILLTPVERLAALRPTTVIDGSIPDPESTRLVSTENTRRPNVVVITLESQRATETLPESEVPVTPVLDGLRASSLVAEQAYSILPHTSKSLVATQCGMEPPFDNENSEGETNGVVAKCLPRLLSEEGYATGFFQSATENYERRRQLATNVGYQHFGPVDELPQAGFSRANYFGWEDDIMLQPSMDWVAALPQDQPFLLTYLTVAAHHDYTLPDIPQTRYSDQYYPNLYLNGVNYQDRFVGKVIDNFKKMGLYDNTVFVIVGDHGEGFWEHGAFGHDDIMYEEGSRVPLMVHAPGMVEPGVYTEPITQATVTPTIVELLGYEVENSAMTEQSLLQAPDGSPVNMTCLEDGECLASVVDGYKYMHFFGDRQDRVFHLETDPGETQNLVSQIDPRWLEAQRERLVIWWLTTNGRYANVREGVD